MTKKLLFFLVDDDLDDQEIFISALKDVDSQIQCTTAGNGCEALQFVAKDEKFIPDFIFLDLNMPKVNGKDCLIGLRKLKRFEKTPIYIYSTSSNQKDIMETRELGATGFIIKPSTISSLIKTLSELILIKKLSEAE